MHIGAYVLEYAYLCICALVCIWLHMCRSTYVGASMFVHANWCMYLVRLCWCMRVDVYLFVCSSERMRVGVCMMVLVC